MIYVHVYGVWCVISVWIYWNCNNSYYRTHKSASKKVNTIYIYNNIFHIYFLCVFS
jgi:hypothetical protein